jgi:hypothetical protein
VFCAALRVPSLQSALGSLPLTANIQSGNSQTLSVALGSMTAATTFRFYAYVPVNNAGIAILKIQFIGVTA